MSFLLGHMYDRVLMRSPGQLFLSFFLSYLLINSVCITLHHFGAEYLSPIGGICEIRLIRTAL